MSARSSEAEPVEPLARLRHRRLLGAAIGRKAEQAGDREHAGAHQLAVLRHDQIFEQRHAGEQADVLERARHAGVARDAVILHALERETSAVAMQDQAAAARPVEAGEAVEHRGLAGAVGADDGGDLAVDRR